MISIRTQFKQKKWMPRDWGIQRPGCAAQIPDRSTGTVDVYVQHAYPPKVSGRTTRPQARCGSAGQPDWPGIASSFRVTSSPHPAFSIRSHGRCALEIVLWLVQSARFASGAWLAPFQRQGGATDRIACQCAGAHEGAFLPIAAWFQAAHRAGHMPPAAARPLTEAASGRARSGFVGNLNHGNEAAPAGGGHVGPCTATGICQGPRWKNPPRPSALPLTGRLAA